MSWIPLHSHSQYSILDSTISIEELVKRAKENGCTSLALTDFGNMYGAVEFYKACLSREIQPIIGIELMIAPVSRHEKKRVYGQPTGHPVTLLAKNNKGYGQLCKLSSKAFLEGFYYYPRIDKELLSEFASDLICLSGPVHGKIGSLIVEDQFDELQEEINWFKELFGDDYYFEISRHKMLDSEIDQDGMRNEMWLIQKYEDRVEKEEKVIKHLSSLSQEHSISLVATADIHYLNRDDWKAHEILLNIQSGEPCEIWERDSFGNPKNRILNPKRKTMYSHKHNFRSSDEMAALFSDYPDAINNTIEVAKKTSWSMDFKKKYYPVFIPPHLEGKKYTKKEREKAAEAYLRELCEKAIPERYPEEHLAEVKKQYPDQEPLDVVRDRLRYELDIITSKEMSDYLLIVYDFIAWAKNSGIPVGPGRGSGAGSIILYLIGITDIEPLRFNLFFERFINPERVSYPDIDVDICMHRRAEVIDYTLRKYGKDNVAQIITFGTMKAKMAIKDVGRVLSVPIAKVNAIAKLVPDDLTITIDKALEVDPDFSRMYEEDEDAKRVIDLARKVEGGIRNTGIHAAGLIICGDALTDHIPVCLSKDSDILATQYSMKPVEQVGMLKIDFLGLKTLTTIQKAADAISQGGDEHIDWVNLPLDDKKTFDLLNHGKTEGIFQLESSGMQELAKQLHIDKFEEIIAVGALYRPGPMEMIPSFINRKHGKEKIEIDHPWMADILKETYGIIVYQEQVMQIASKLANYSLGEGDVLRRAMGKKDKKEMSRQREKFRKGAIENEIDEDLAMSIFDKVEKFASYGFNKSHAAAYGYLSYVTAYFKSNYPGEWMAALMTCDMDDISKVAKHIRECKSMNIDILAPDINESGTTFVATKKGIRFALNAIKGVGEGVVISIVEERNANGPFSSLQQLLKRVDTTKIGKKVIEQLIRAGCFDFTGKVRQALIQYLDDCYDGIVKQKKDLSKGILDLFSGEEEESDDDDVREDIPEMPKLELLQVEKELLGFYLTGHPLDEYEELLTRLQCVPMSSWEGLPHLSVVKSAFVVDTVQTRIAHRSQKKFAIAVISNGVERFELPVWPEQFEKVGHLLDENALILAILQLEKNDDQLRLQCRWMGDLTDHSESMEKEIEENYEKACQQARSDFQREKRFKSKGKKKDQGESMEKEKKDPIRLVLDLEKLSMKKLLELKKRLYECGGSTPLQVAFSHETKQIGTIDLDTVGGVKDLETVKEMLENEPYFVEISLEK